MPSEIPSHNSIQRVIAIINPSTLYTNIIKYLINLVDNLASPSKERGYKNIDKKTIMEVQKRTNNRKDFIERKLNEIPMGPDLLKIAIAII